jgi:hypothetical protein
MSLHHKGHIHGHPDPTEGLTTFLLPLAVKGPGAEQEGLGSQLKLCPMARGQQLTPVLLAPPGNRCSVAPLGSAAVNWQMRLGKSPATGPGLGLSGWGRLWTSLHLCPACVHPFRSIY